MTNPSKSRSRSPRRSRSNAAADPTAHIPAAPSNLREKRLAFDRSKMTPPTNDRLIRAAKQQMKAGERSPMWVMRQAGRYLPEFRAIRVENNFFDVCSDPRLATEVTLQPFFRYPDLDAVIIFSDILVIPVAMGMPCEMVKGEGPKFPKPLTQENKDMLILQPDVEKELGYVFDAVHLTRLRLMEKEQNVPVIGFAGAPWSLFSYMVEGGGSRNWDKAKSWLYKNENEAKEIMKAIRDIVIAYLIKKYDAGASMLQIFDTNAGELPAHIYEKHIVPDLLHIATEIKKQRPQVILSMFPKDAKLEPFANSAYDVIGVSWKTMPEDAIRACPKKTLQGNLDPCVLFASESQIKEEVKIMCKKFEKAAGHICNLGHGMMPNHTPEALRAAIDAAKGK